MEHKIAIIGAGDIVRKAYLPILTRRSDCHILAICSESGHTARELAKQYNIPFTCQDYHEILLLNDIDVVLICTPTASHHKIAEAVIASQKHVLVEKPLCATYSDSHALLQKAKQCDCIFYPAFNNRFREENQHFYRRILDDEIGAIELIDFEWFRTKRHGHKPWLYDPTLSGGGVLIDLGTHLIHLALGLVQDRETFTATCLNFFHSPEISPVEDTTTALVCIDQKISILLKLGRDMHMNSASKVDLQIFGQNGLVTNQEYDGEKTDGYNYMIQDFFNHIETRTHPDLSLVDDTMLLVSALYQSAHEKVAVQGRFTTMDIA